MKRRRPYSQPRLSRDAERLVWLAQGLAGSGSRVEDAFWERELSVLINSLLAAGQDEPMNLALDRLSENGGGAYDSLADLIEAEVEGAVMPGEDGPMQVLLVAMPVLAWSRYGIPARALPAEAVANLKVQLAAHVLAEGTRVALADYLFSPDQLPHGYGEIHELAEFLWRQALAGDNGHIDAAKLPESGQFISDVRYLLAAVAVPAGHAVFRWNEVDGSREAALKEWRAQAGPSLNAVLPGCSFELLQPDAYFAAWRRADNEGRPYALAASVDYLRATLDVPAAGLHAVVAAYYEQRLVEWRIGFSLAEAGEVVHGVVWPLLNAEDEGRDMGAEIREVLKAAGVQDVRLLDQRMPLEFCDDCGMPLFPNAEGESVHPEMPEEADAAPQHLH